MALQAELEVLTHQILSANGLSGRFRSSRDDCENFRKAVSMAIGRSIKVIRKHHSALADHLHRNIDRGHFLIYTGEIPWQF